jgi:hypothetical protein
MGGPGGGGGDDDDGDDDVDDHDEEEEDDDRNSGDEVDSRSSGDDDNDNNHDDGDAIVPGGGDARRGELAKGSGGSHDLDETRRGVSSSLRSTRGGTRRRRGRGCGALRDLLRTMLRDSFLNGAYAGPAIGCVSEL